MIIVIKLSSGKEIELTEAEYQELKGFSPYPPIYPATPWSPTYPYPVITCKNSSTSI